MKSLFTSRFHSPFILASLCLACLIASYIDTPTLRGQEFSPFTKNQPPEFTTAMIKDGTLRFVEKSDVKSFQSEVVEVLVPKKRAVKKPVMVQVPYTTEIDGKAETLFRTETRFETVYETYMEKKLQQKFVPSTTRKMILNEVSLARKIYFFEKVDGTKLGDQAVLDTFSEWTPAVIVRDGEQLSPYFRKILNPETILILEQKRERRTKPVNESPQPMLKRKKRS